MKIALILIMITLIFSCGNTTRKNSLLIAEFRKDDDGLGNFTYLVSYNFTDGKMVSKDTILSAPTSKGQYQGSYVRYELGQNFVYKNRYVISAIGNVIDVKTKSLVMEESDDFIEARGDSIIFHRNTINETGYLICDLKNRTYEFVNDKNFLNVKGINSPNHRWGLEIDKSEIPYKIILYDDKNRKSVIVNDCGIGTSLSIYASTLSNIPLFWLDNQNFLYASFSTLGSRIHLDSAIATAIIYKINIETKISEIVSIIDSVPLSLSQSSFFIDPLDRIIFYCEKGDFEIDIQNKKAIPYIMSSVGNDFSIENNRNENYGSIIAFFGKEIGRVWCNYYNAKTTKGFIGVEYGEIGSNLGYPKGVRVWNNLTNKWKDIEIPYMSGIIGWIEN